MIGNETITRVRPAPVGRHGDPGDAPSETSIDECVIWPTTGANEKTFAQDTVIIGYQALFPPGTDIVATDQARWRGQLFDVTGEPGIYSSPFGSPDPGVLVNLRRVTG